MIIRRAKAFMIKSEGDLNRLNDFLNKYSILEIKSASGNPYSFLVTVIYEEDQKEVI